MCICELACRKIIIEILIILNYKTRYGKERREKQGQTQHIVCAVCIRNLYNLQAGYYNNDMSFICWTDNIGEGKPK